MQDAFLCQVANIVCQNRLFVNVFKATDKVELREKRTNREKARALRRSRRAVYPVGA